MAGYDGQVQTPSFSSQLRNGPNKLECLSLTSISSLVYCNSLAYWVHLYVTKTIKCFHFGPWFMIIWFFFIKTLSNIISDWKVPKNNLIPKFWRHDNQHNDTQYNVFICDTQHRWHSAEQICLECHYVECRNLITVMLNIVILSFIMLNVVMLPVVMLSVVVPNFRNFVVSIAKTTFWCYG